MRVSVLGTLEVEENGRIITPTARKRRQVIALLAVHAGQVVPVRVLCEELWGPTPPPSAQQTLQTYVLHLRKLIDSAYGGRGTSRGKAVLATRDAGYLLHVPPDGLDVRAFERLVGDGRNALRGGDYSRASVLLGAALTVWRGPALVDVRTGGPLSAKVRGLEEARLYAQEARIDADMRLGRHHQLLGELGELNARYPLHEAVCAHYMTALYRCGRRWRALEVFRALREALVAELGLEPSMRVRGLQHAILNADPALETMPVPGPARQLAAL